MSEAITVIAFYFAAISLASTLFFNRVESWYSQIRSFQVRLEHNDSEQYRQDETEYKSLSAATPTAFAFFVTILVIGLGVLGIFLPIPARPPFDPVLYLRAPLVVAAALFWGYGILRYFGGRCRLGKANQRIQRGKSGKPNNE